MVNEEKILFNKLFNNIRNVLKNCNSEELNKDYYISQILGDDESKVLYYNYSYFLNKFNQCGLKIDTDLSKIHSIYLRIIDFELYNKFANNVDNSILFSANIENINSELIIKNLFNNSITIRSDYDCPIGYNTKFILGVFTDNNTIYKDYKVNIDMNNGFILTTKENKIEFNIIVCAERYNPSKEFFEAKFQLDIKIYNL